MRKSIRSAMANTISILFGSTFASGTIGAVEARDSIAQQFPAETAPVSRGSTPLATRVETGNQVCSGVFLSPTQVLTAAHCVQSGEIRVFGEAPTEVIAHPLWPRGQTWSHVQIRRYDLAILRFPRPLTTANAKIATNKPKNYSKAWSIGSGLRKVAEGAQDSYQYRVDSHIVPSPFHGLLHVFSHQGNGSIAHAHGDSGGPLFDNRGELIGICSAIVRTINDGIEETTTAFVDLSNAETKRFVLNAMK